MSPELVLVITLMVVGVALVLIGQTISSLQRQIDATHNFAMDLSGSMQEMSNQQLRILDIVKEVNEMHGRLIERGLLEAVQDAVETHQDAAGE